MPFGINKKTQSTTLQASLEPVYNVLYILLKQKKKIKQNLRNGDSMALLSKTFAEELTQQHWARTSR